VAGDGVNGTGALRAGNPTISGVTSHDDIVSAEGVAPSSSPHREMDAEMRIFSDDLE
jgi:hypothetical protein